MTKPKKGDIVSCKRIEHKDFADSTNGVRVFAFEITTHGNPYPYHAFYRDDASPEDKGAWPSEVKAALIEPSEPVSA